MGFILPFKTNAKILLPYITAVPFGCFRIIKNVSRVVLIIN
jgi:hypothetical protein